MSTAMGFSALVQSFFTRHLIQHKQVSPRTITAYRDTFRLLFKFIEDRTGRSPSDLDITDLDSPAILAFLDHLEADRSNHARSRNVRLSAIRSFFRFASVRDVGNLAVASRVLAIPNKRSARPMMTFLTRPEIDAVLATTDQKTWMGSRDHALLLTMYNTGARAAEITTLRCGQVSFGRTTLIRLHGKGRKDRTVPLWPQTSRVLRRWFQVLVADEAKLAFPSGKGTTLSSDGLDYILQRAVKKATLACPSLLNKRVTPHALRRTTAMHLLQGGVDIAVIALWLGHESIETTHGYVEADLEIKQRALDKLTPASGKVSRYKPSDCLMRFLTSL